MEDLAYGRVTPLVKDFLISSYVRGACKNQGNVGFEESTACFTKRRYRDRWNKHVQERNGRRHGRALRIKAVFAPRGTESQWIREEAANAIRRTVRSQCLMNLRLAGQWLEDAPLPGATRPHCMRAMLVANVDVPNGFANGACARVVYWGPEPQEASDKRRAVLANTPGVMARFYHEAAWTSQKKHFLPEIDFIDLEPKRETVTSARGKPCMLQLTLQPAYGLTIHKVQALTIWNKVQGCLEGVFALGQVYVLSSRVTDPDNFQLVGVPPQDLLEEVARAWQQQGLDVDKCFAAAAEVTQEWEYEAAATRSHPCHKVLERLHPRMEKERRVPLRLKRVEDILNPQPDTAEVVHAVLEWIKRCDVASQKGEAAPPAVRLDGAALFPEHEWWLTDFERRKPTPENAEGNGDEIYEDADLTRDPEEAWWRGSASESSGSVVGESGDDSEGSLPAGPHAKAPRLVLRAPLPCSQADVRQKRAGQAGLSLTGTATRRRLRWKQPAQCCGPVNDTSDIQAGGGEDSAQSVTMQETIFFINV